MKCFNVTIQDQFSGREITHVQIDACHLSQDEHGQTWFKMNPQKSVEVIKVREVPRPTWADVTMNGRYSCD